MAKNPTYTAAVALCKEGTSRAPTAIPASNKAYINRGLGVLMRWRSASQQPSGRLPI